MTDGRNCPPALVRVDERWVCVRGEGGVLVTGEFPQSYKQKAYKVVFTVIMEPVRHLDSILFDWEQILCAICLCASNQLFADVNPEKPIVTDT